MTLSSPIGCDDGIVNICGRKRRYNDEYDDHGDEGDVIQEYGWRSYQDKYRYRGTRWDILTKQLDNAFDHMWNRINNDKINGNDTHAYVCLVYGNRIDIIGQAIACANSIHNNGSIYDVICMVTDDVCTEYIQILNMVFDNIVNVPIIYGASSLYKKDWFKEVFTKLHIFNRNVLPYTSVLFIDCDVCIIKPIDDIFNLRPPAAMENSKGGSSWNNNELTPSPPPSFWLKHGEHMNGRCWLINAGVILASPDNDIFQLLCTDISMPQEHHLKGMTPEQYYLAGILGPYLSHIDQSLNFEIQLHGGVPITDKWKELNYDDIRLIHFSGGEIQSALYPQSFLGRQDKYWARQAYDRLSWDIKDLSYNRAQAAWCDFNINLANAINIIKNNIGNDSNIDDIDNMLKYAHLTAPAAPAAAEIIYDISDNDEWYAIGDDDNSSDDDDNNNNLSLLDPIQVHIGSSYQDDDGEEWILVKIIPEDDYTCIFVSSNNQFNNNKYGRRRYYYQTSLSEAKSLLCF